MKKVYYSFLILFNLYIQAESQSISINNDASLPHSSSILDIKSTDKGFLLPRMTTTERSSIVTPAEGLIVYDTDRKALFLFDGTNWKILVPSDPNSVNTLNNIQHIVPPNIIPESDYYPDQLGTSVGIFGNYLFVGAQGFNDRPGYVLVYRHNLSTDNWDYFQVINPPTTVSLMKFGYSIVAKSNYLFIGAPGDVNGSSVTTGSIYVYIFNGTNWVYSAKILPSNSIANGDFGKLIDVTTNSDKLLTYAPGPPFSSGSSYVYVYKRTGTLWGTPQSIPLDNVSSVSFQHDGEFFILGIINPNETIGSTLYTKPGKVSLYVISGPSAYTFAVDIINPDPSDNDQFGSTVMFAENYNSFAYIILIASKNQVQIGSLDPATFSYNFSGQGKTFDGINNFGYKLTKSDPFVSNFTFSGVSELFFVGDDEKLSIYSSGGAAAWFAQKGRSIALPEVVAYLNVGTKYSIGTYANSTDNFFGQTTYIVIGTPYANDAKGAFYILKSQ